MDQALEVTLRQVLAPFAEEDREEMIAWVKHEADTRPLHTLYENADGVVWQIGKENPTNESLIVFAILYEEEATKPCMHIYSCGAVKSESGETGMVYFKDVSFNLKHVHGPIAPRALMFDWGEFMAADIEDRIETTRKQANGSAGGEVPAGNA
jgi:hypothetical protein